MARKKEFDERQALIKAMLVFWKKGYEATSIQDLEKAMGINRTSIYNAFGNKRRLFERVLSCYRESVMSNLFRQMDEVPDIRTGVRRLLHAALDVHFNEAYPGGCLVVLSVLESGQHEQNEGAVLAGVIQGLRQQLKVRLVGAKKRGELPAALDTGATATAIASIMTGLMVLGKAQFSRASLNRAVKQALTLLDEAA